MQSLQGVSFRPTVGYPQPTATPAVDEPSTTAEIQDALSLSAVPAETSALDQLGGAKAARKEFKSTLDLISQMKPLPSKTFLVRGNSGTGKTTLVKAFQHDLERLGIPSHNLTGGSLALGGPEAIQQGFQEAAKQAANNPYHTAALFIDDIESIARIRDNGSNETSTKNAHMLAVLADQIDKNESDPQTNVVVIGASSRPDDMDWLATQRFKTTITTQAPANPEERLEVLNSMVKRADKKVEPSALQELADVTPGKTQRELQSILAEAEKSGELSAKSLREARLTTEFGAAKAVTVPDSMFRLSVAHELGHAVIRNLFDMMSVEDGRPDHRPMGIDCLSFVPREGTQASVALKPSGFPTKTFEYYFAEISSNYGGRAAEYLFGQGHVSAGPGNDIQFASSLVEEAVNQKGMGQSLGPVNPTSITGDTFKEQASTDKRKILQAAEQAAMSIVYFYGDFINQSSANFLNHKDDASALVWSGADFSKAMTDWEGANPERMAQLKALKGHLKEQIQGLQPQLPMVWDPLTGHMIPAQKAAEKFSSNFT